MSKARNLSKVIVDTSGVVDRDSLDVETVAKTGSYNDLTDKPTLGTAAATASTDYATAAQGTKADTAYGWGNHASAGYASYPSQTGNTGKYLTTDGTSASWDALATVANSGSYNDLTDKPTLTTNLDGLTDVVITSPVSDEVLKYNGTNWVNGTGGGGGVTSFNTRTGAVTLTSGDVTTALTYTPATAAQGSNADTAYSWGDHASAGYLTTSSAATTYQPLDADLTTLATNGFGTSANQIPKYDASGWLLLGAGWKVKEDTGVLYFAAGATNYMKLDASGNLTVLGNVTANGTI